MIYMYKLLVTSETSVWMVAKSSVPSDRAHSSFLVTSMAWLLHLLFEASTSKELTHFEELHPGLLSMELLFFKLQFLGFPPRKKNFFFCLCSLNLS